MELPHTVCRSLLLPLSLSLLSFPLRVPSSHFISIPLSPPLPNQVLGRGGGIMCAGVLICHTGPCSCNQNSFWANLCVPFEHAQSYTHRLPGLSKYSPTDTTSKHDPHAQPSSTVSQALYLIYNSYPINNTRLYIGFI